MKTYYRQLQSKNCSPWKCSNFSNYSAEINISTGLLFAECQDLESFFGDSVVQLTNKTGTDLQAEDRPLTCHYKELLQQRNKDPRNVLICYLNINSAQNKIEELKQLNKSLKSQIIFLRETKIENSYPDAKFEIDGYKLHMAGRKKGGGGLME